MPQRKEPTPIAKYDIDIGESRDFLSKRYGHSIEEIEELGGGKHSKAFSYKNSGTSLVIRFNAEDRGFQKDRHASELFGNELPIPKVLEIGKYKNLYFCITEKVIGETVRDQYNRNDFSSLPLLFDAIEQISRKAIAGVGYGYLDLTNNAPYGSHLDYIDAVYGSKDIFDWDKIFLLPFVDKSFTDYVASRLKHFSKYATQKRELLHGDFGADNVFVDKNSISGIIDWEKMRCGDRFLDIGRVIFFCPNRRATANAAIDYYKKIEVEHWKERAAMGIYHVVLNNYAYAALGGNEVSCKSSSTRLQELERGLELI